MKMKIGGFLVGSLFGGTVTASLFVLYVLNWGPAQSAFRGPYRLPDSTDPRNALEIAGTAHDMTIFNREMRNARTYLEYGAGGSTTLAALTVSDMVYSIEPYVLWCEKLQQNSLVKQRMAAGRMEMACPEAPYKMQAYAFKAKPKQIPDEDIERQAEELPYGEFFVTAPETTGLKGGTVDLVLVDSRYRVACALYASRYMRSDSRLLIHDFWTRDQYTPLFTYFDLVLAPASRSKSAIAAQQLSVEFSDSGPFDSKEQLLPVLGDQEMMFKAAVAHGSKFAVFKLKSSVLKTRVPGEPLPEYLDYLTDEWR